jgi:hypothetical protein
MRLVVVALAWLVGIFPTFAACSLDRVVGYTLVAKKTVVGFIKDDKREEGFSGCEYGKVLVFEDNTGVRCTAYSYSYAYRPDAYIFLNSSAIKVCIEGEWFDAERLR